MPRGGSLKSLVPDWAATLVENLREGDPQFKTVAALCFDKLVWKGDPERLRRVIHQEVITRCAVELKMSQEELSEQLAKPRIPLLTVLAISRALGGES